MTVRTIPPHGAVPICRINSGPLAPLPDMPVYEPKSGPHSTDLPTRLLTPPPPPIEWLDLREAIRRGSESHRPYTLHCAIMDAQITHDPQKQIAVGTVTVISGYVWRKVSVFQDVYAAMINSFTGLLEAQWQVVIA